MMLNTQNWDLGDSRFFGGPQNQQTQMLHIWYIYLHLDDFWGKCWYIFQHHGAYGNDKFQNLSH
jgi:hypothetical protein